MWYITPNVKVKCRPGVSLYLLWTPLKYSGLHERVKDFISQQTTLPKLSHRSMSSKLRCVVAMLYEKSR